MSITYTVKHDGQYVIARVTDILTLEEVMQYQDAIDTDDAIKPGFVELFDVRQLDATWFDNKTFLKIAERVEKSPKRNKGSKLAIVSKEGPTSQRGKYYETLPDKKQNVIIFNFIKTAEVWLGVDDSG